MITSVDLAQLQALASVLDEGSFDAAAAVLHLTPSAVSQRIKALERSTGQVLVQRGRPATATEAGETYLRLARQLTTLVEEARREAGERAARPTVPLAVNADSLATWVLPALAPVAGSVALDLRRQDQAHTAGLLRSGAVMAAITSEAEPVQGCRSTRLGTMRYRPVAAPAYVERWFAGGVHADTLAEAPIVVFDRKDHLQDDYLRRVTRRRIDPPRHYVPSSADFAQAIRLGFGWGLLPRQQYADLEAAGDLVVFDTGRHVDVTLHWQQWSLRTPALDAVADAIRTAATTALDR